MFIKREQTFAKVSFDAYLNSTTVRKTNFEAFQNLVVVLYKPQGRAQIVAQTVQYTGSSSHWQL
jgi:hypothetical protein